MACTERDGRKDTVNGDRTRFRTAIHLAEVCEIENNSAPTFPRRTYRFLPTDGW